ncbi:MAG: bacillithiol biosynthesis deacetylase BshB1 [Planctomycetaceae bacterium]|nr:bacillithiol biosynthesis deacetylase BshB1 [Planctomycetaceae bacterium]
MLDLLVVATHPDDAEISVGGLVAKAISEGLKVGIVDLTSGEPTPRGSLEIRARETAAATRVLGVQFRENLDLPNRSLQADLNARRELANVFRRTRPRLILAPWEEDAHPDHVQASRLCDDARFWAKLSRTDLDAEPYWPPRMMYYLSIHLRIHPKPAVVVDISPWIEQKLSAIRCYESQGLDRTGDPIPTPLDDIRDRARYWGWSIHTAYAEPLLAREEFRIDQVRSLLPLDRE